MFQGGCMLRQLRPGETQAEVNRRQATLLFVAGADSGPFLVGEQGNVDGTRPVPSGELSWTADVNQWTRQRPEFFDGK